MCWLSCCKGPWALSCLCVAAWGMQVLHLYKKDLVRSWPGDWLDVGVQCCCQGTEYGVVWLPVCVLGHVAVSMLPSSCMKEESVIWDTWRMNASPYELDSVVVSNRGLPVGSSLLWANQSYLFLLHDHIYCFNVVWKLHNKTIMNTYANIQCRHLLIKINSNIAALMVLHVSHSHGIHGVLCLSALVHHCYYICQKSQSELLLPVPHSLLLVPVRLPQKW